MIAHGIKLRPLPLPGTGRPRSRRHHRPGPALVAALFIVTGLTIGAWGADLVDLPHRRRSYHRLNPSGSRWSKHSPTSCSPPTTTAPPAGSTAASSKSATPNWPGPLPRHPHRPTRPPNRPQQRPHRPRPPRRSRRHPAGRSPPHPPHRPTPRPTLRRTGNATTVPRTGE